MSAQAKKQNVLPRPPRARKRAEEVRAKLGLDPADMDGEPRITQVWRAAEGGIKQVIEALRFSDDEDAIDFLEKYDSLTQTDRKLLTIEEIAVASKVGTRRLHEVASSALLDMEHQAAVMMLATSKRKLIRKSMEMAMTDKGAFDRENMLKATNVLPTPKGSTITIPLTVNQQTVNALPAGETRELPSAEERQEIVQRAFATRALAAPKEPVTIPAIDPNLSKRQEIVGHVLSPQGS